jgi:hypothetical protein
MDIELDEGVTVDKDFAFSVGVVSFGDEQPIRGSTWSRHSSIS